MKWVLFSNLIAWPMAFIYFTGWLRHFSYRINLGILPFLFALGIAAVIAFLTVGIQCIKAALANPVDSLKYE